MYSVVKLFVHVWVTAVSRHEENGWIVSCHAALSGFIHTNKRVSTYPAMPTNDTTVKIILLQWWCRWFPNCLSARNLLSNSAWSIATDSRHYNMADRYCETHGTHIIYNIYIVYVSCRRQKSLHANTKHRLQ